MRAPIHSALPCNCGIAAKRNTWMARVLAVLVFFPSICWWNLAISVPTHLWNIFYKYASTLWFLCKAVTCQSMHRTPMQLPDCNLGWLIMWVVAFVLSKVVNHRRWWRLQRSWSFHLRHFTISAKHEILQLCVILVYLSVGLSRII